MTAVTYLVGDNEFKTYKEAKRQAETQGLPIAPKYTPIGETGVLNHKGKIK